MLKLNASPVSYIVFQEGQLRILEEPMPEKTYGSPGLSGKKAPTSSLLAKMMENDSIVIVTGLPRSGTSLMMQMLQAGGLPVLIDEHRPADPSNPRGYFEYQKVKNLPADQSWMGDARGKALKVIAQLTPFLPRGFRYQVLFMRRDLQEVLQSQSTMIKALGMSVPGNPDLLAPVFSRHLVAAQDFIRQQPFATMETVDFHELITTPETVIDRIIQFLQLPFFDRQAMVRSVDAKLYRSRIDGLAR